MKRRFHRWEEPQREDYKTDQEYEDALEMWEAAEMAWEDEYIESRRGTDE